MEKIKDKVINKCNFCGKNLKTKEIVFNMGVEKIQIQIGQERCDCKQAQEFWKIHDFKAQKIKNEKEKYEKEERIKRFYEYSKMNRKLKDYTFSNFKINEDNIKAYEKVKKYAESIVNGNKNSLFITGKVGTGKTYLAACIANYLIKNEQRVIFGTLINILNEVKDTYSNSNETESYIIDKYSKVKLLIIDDLGKEKPSEWTLEKLFTIINNRYENNLPVVITTNYNRNELIERLADGKNYIIAESIISRLYEMCNGICLKGKDKRKELV